MNEQLRVSIGHHSEAGRKDINQDFHGAWVPGEPQLGTKGVALAVADGISSSEVSQIASELAVTGFLQDYYCTSEAWSVRRSAQRVLTATNSWLHAQTRRSQYRYDMDRGYVCTFSALILKSATAHLFHVGDARIYRLDGNALEPLTEDHRLRVSPERSYLSRALGISPHVEIDYQSLPVEPGDVFILATDGVYEHVAPGFVVETIRRPGADLDRAARAIVAEAYAGGSDDNLTLQIVRIDALPRRDAEEHYQQLTELPFPPVLEPGMTFDGYRILRELHGSSRSHVFLAQEEVAGNAAPVVLKIPSIDQREDPAYLERFLTEDWIARRIDSPHVLSPRGLNRRRNYLYSVSEYIDGRSLRQWMMDNPRPDLETVRDVVEQIARGLRAFHRLEMLHQDLRPDNVMIDRNGTAKIIDFGSAQVAGLAEMDSPIPQGSVPGTVQYTAPEYFLGAQGEPRSDLYSLGVIAYQMLSGRLPYGPHAARAHSPTAQSRLRYTPLPRDERNLPPWLDEVLKKAVEPDPGKRYQDPSEFAFELRQPSRALLNRSRPPLLERDPLLFWKGISLLLAVALVLLLLR